MLFERLHERRRVEKPRLLLQIARSAAEVAEAQKLRYRVFVEEMGARPNIMDPGLDRDIFDPFCDHLLVRDGETNEVVGTYRILTGMQAKKAGGFYSDGEFDLAPLARLRRRMMEVGRSCVHPQYRDGAAIMLLMSGVVRHALKHGCEYIVGCASVSMADGGQTAARAYARLKGLRPGPAEFQVNPRRALRLETVDAAADAAIPPLIKAYLRLGAHICSAPTWDPEFNTADFFMLLPLANISPRYLKRFMEADEIGNDARCELRAA